jgi:hypothetical protein
MMREDWIKQLAASRRAKWDAAVAETKRIANETAGWTAHYAEFWQKLLDNVEAAVDTYNESVGIPELHVRMTHDDRDIHLMPLKSTSPLMKVTVDQIAEQLTVKCEGGNGNYPVALDYPIELGKEGLYLSFDGITIPENSMARRILELFFQRLE